MGEPAVSSFRKIVAAFAALVLTFSMAPLAWADDGPTGIIAGTVAGSEGVEGSEGAFGSEAPTSPQPPSDPSTEASAEVQSADAKAADAAGSATGTTIKIAVYRSSYPLVWDTGDAGAPDATKVVWSKPEAWPKEGSPGSAVGTYAGYSEADEPTRPGFGFLGWSAVKDDPTVAGKLSSLQIPKGTEPVAGEDGVKRITLHALWAPIEYSVVFDLTKNPEDASAVPSFSWTTGKGTFSDLGGGRYRLSGVTLEDYDPERGLIEISTPSRGTGGYRFLSWAEPDSQQSPTVAMQPSGTSKWYVNPVALPYYDYEPVLTARWSLSFDVDVPSQITFDEYDSLEQEGNLTDTTDKDEVDEESPDLHDKGKLAHFCSQSTAADYKIVALKSEMQPTAKDILTTSDSSKASQEQVLSDEKLLSLFAATDESESAGVHFKLTDAIDMDDSSRYGAFVIPKQTKEYSDGDFARDDEERLYVSYRLNLDNAVDGSSEPNHGLVTPANVNEGDRTPIAKVSYEFAVADGEVEKTIPGDPFYVEDSGTFYGLDYIKQAAIDLGANGNSSPYYVQFRNYLDNATPFKLKVGNGYYDVHVIGIAQDNATAGGKAGLTFCFKGHWARLGTSLAGTSVHSYMNTSASNSGGWNSAYIRSYLQGSFFGLLDAQLRDSSTGIVPVTKVHQLASGVQTSSNQTVWIPSAYEVFGATLSGCNDNENASNSFQYQYFAKGGKSSSASSINAYAVKKEPTGSDSYWWLRSAVKGKANFLQVHWKGYLHTTCPSTAEDGMLPCFCL